MINKQIILLGIFLLALATIGYSAACGTTPTEDCYVDTNGFFLRATYLLNDTAGNGVMTINKSNIDLNFNASVLQGNSTIGSIGIVIEAGKRNITIRNFNITGFTKSIDIASTSQPDFGTIANNVNYTTYDYNPTTKTLTVSCNGIGTCSLGLAQMNVIYGTNNAYNVYDDGTFVETAKTSTYTQTFKTIGTYVSNSVGINGLASTERSLMFALALCIVFGIVSFAFLDGKTSILIGVLGLAIAILLLQVIFG